MLFNSWHFIVFLFVVLSVSAWLPRTGTAWKLFMVAASCYFYGQWSYLYLLLIFVTAAVDFTIAQRLLKSAHPGRFLAISIVAKQTGLQPSRVFLGSSRRWMSCCPSAFRFIRFRI